MVELWEIRERVLGPGRPPGWCERTSAAGPGHPYGVEARSAGTVCGAGITDGDDQFGGPSWEAAGLEGALVVDDLVLRPHCDLHMALTGTPPLVLRLFERTSITADPLRYKVAEVVPPFVFDVDFFAPHNPVGHRFDDVPKFNTTTRVVTATKPGVYLFQVRHLGKYIVGRLQVHQSVESWWFGNDSITAAVDPILAHTQPSIYAKFAPDDKGTDLVGDITGHPYVTLASATPAKVVPTPEGRLRGVAPTSGTPGTVDVTGSFMGVTKTLKVRVVNYAEKRRHLFPVRVSDIPGHTGRHNIVFIGEGFRESERTRFEEIVTKTTTAMFTKSRHEPYPMLVNSFNVFRAFAPSQEHTVTPGFKITDKDVPGIASKGLPIPYNALIGTDDAKFYTMEQLVAKVGLPMRGESRPNLPQLWADQSLDHFTAAQVNPELLTAWKAHQSEGILHARDTFFGIKVGGRWADRRSGDGPVPPPLNPAGQPVDVKGAPLDNFVKRLYEFYRATTTRLFTLDPRRHAPEVCSSPANNTDPGNLIMSYLGGLEYERTPFPLIGPVWAPDDKNFKRSRGMVVVIINDGMDGGASINFTSMTTSSCNSGQSMAFTYTNRPDGSQEMRRSPNSEIDTDVDDIINTVAHELGHSFNLQDEYEDFGNDPAEAAETTDNRGDNVARLGFIHAAGHGPREVDPSKVKWLTLPRIRLSDRLVAPAKNVTGGVEVAVHQSQIAKWVQAQADNAVVSLRRFQFEFDGKQLPTLPGNLIENLKIAGKPNEAAGTFVLSGAGLSPPPNPPFEAGSMVYVQLKDEHGHPLQAVEEKVLAHLSTSHLPLNSDPDTTKPSKDPDGTVSISGFKGPCKSRKVIGIWEGAVRFAGGMYRPAGDCKMRDSGDAAFCFVCKWLIVNRVNPGAHAILTERFYPKAKKSG